MCDANSSYAWLLEGCWLRQRCAESCTRHVWFRLGLMELGDLLLESSSQACFVSHWTTYIFTFLPSIRKYVYVYVQHIGTYERTVVDPEHQSKRDSQRSCHVAKGWQRRYCRTRPAVFRSISSQSPTCSQPRRAQ